jgi:murein DD-endopeptidase MepM/ murein hydrolase activator NlpD
VKGHAFLNSENILRILLACSVFYFIQALNLFPGGAVKAQSLKVDAENGMGGLDASVIPISSESSEAAGVLEPEEYSKPRMLLYGSYKMRPDDNVSQLAKDFGLNQDTLLSMNGVKYPRAMQIGQELRVPNQDGILYTVKKGDTLASIAQKYDKYGVSPRSIQTVNELFSENAGVGDKLFIPGARLDTEELLEITGDLFLWPIRGYITSSYGYRTNPFTGRRQFHSGLDIGSPYGTPVRAAMAGRVTAAGYDATFGNYVVISHHAGYRTLYGHMSVLRVKSGTYVGAGERIGDVGSTGLSTGPHLHFTVYKNGVTMNPRNVL